MSVGVSSNVPRNQLDGGEERGENFKVLFLGTKLWSNGFWRSTLVPLSNEGVSSGGKQGEEREPSNWFAPVLIILQM